MRRPQSGEYGEYYQHYIDLTRGSNNLQNLEDSANTLINYLENLAPERRDYSYDEGKWTIHQMIQHIMDCDMVFTSRALWIARGGETTLPGFDQNNWAETSMDALTEWDELITQFKNLRAYSISLYRSFPEKLLDNAAQVSGYNTTIRSLAFITAGHTFHHLDILKTRYA